MAGKAGRPKGFIMPESHRQKIQAKAIARSQWFRETAHLREAVEAGNERLAVFLVREMLRSRKAAALWGRKGTAGQKPVTGTSARWGKGTREHSGEPRNSSVKGKGRERASIHSMPSQEE